MGGRRISQKDFGYRTGRSKTSQTLPPFCRGILGYDKVNKDLILTLKDGTAEQRDSENDF